MTGSLISVIFLIYQAFFADHHRPAKTAARIMLAGLILGFVPGIFYQIIGEAFTNSSGSSLGFALALWAIPLMPIFYLYAIYKRQLGNLEFRANRVLSIYSFVLLYPPAFLILILFGENRISAIGPRTAYLMAVSTLFIIFMNPILSRYQKWINKLAYGTTHNPDDLIRLFASRIPLTRKQKDLVMLLENEFLPSLLIRESAMLLLAEGKQQILYVQGWQKTAVSIIFQHLELLKQTAGEYRPPILTTTLPWLRLVIPLTSGNQLIGYWLFGSRDPDDFYPLPDINLLTDLANEIAPVLENIQLYENLEIQVEKRTAELSAERDRTQAILEAAGEGIFFTDTLGRIMYANPAMSRITGFMADYAHIPLHEWIYDDEETAVSLTNAIKTQQSWSGQTTLLRPDKSTIDISLILTPLKTSHPNLSGFVGVISDISHFKEIDKFKSNIISNVSHELKTPLANITLYIDLLERSGTENHPRYIETLKQNANRLNTLIQDLLDLAKLETDELPTQRTPISIIDIIQKTVKSLAPLAQKAKKTLNMQLPNHLPPVLADEQQIEQVLSNLITNSLKYSEQAGVITISAWMDKLDHQPAIAVSVIDNGLGIPQHELPFIFDRFFRGETHKNQPIAGSGLGLAICKEIIERHHGRIAVKSTPYEETRFTFWLHTIKPNS
jgi:PAS domain S-box-containing protein